VNFELPHVSEDYIHRIGRTARAGHDGTAISLVCIDEQKLLQDIESLLKRNIQKEFMPGYEVDKRIKAEPVQKGRPSQGKPRGSGGPRSKGPRPAGRKRPGKNARGNQRKRSNGSARSRAS
jgi:ATP-dependent RNA helicase RhlE